MLSAKSVLLACSVTTVSHVYKLGSGLATDYYCCDDAEAAEDGTGDYQTTDQSESVKRDQGGTASDR